jgi:hypothetical protein
MYFPYYRCRRVFLLAERKYFRSERAINISLRRSEDNAPKLHLKGESCVLWFVLVCSDNSWAGFFEHQRPGLRFSRSFVIEVIIGGADCESGLLEFRVFGPGLR